MANKTVLIGTPRKDGAGTPAHEEWTTGDTPVDPDGNPLTAGVGNFLGFMQWVAQVNSWGDLNPMISPVLTWPVGTKKITWVANIGRCYRGVMGAKLSLSGAGHFVVDPAVTGFAQNETGDGGGGGCAGYAASAVFVGCPFIMMWGQPGTLGWCFPVMLHLVGMNAPARQLQMQALDTEPGGPVGIGGGVQVFFHCFG